MSCRPDSSRGTPGTSRRPARSRSHTRTNPRMKSAAAGSAMANETGWSKTMPNAPTRPRRRVLPKGLGPGYPSSWAVRRIRSRRSGLSWSGRLYAFDIVILLTPSWRAMDSRVERFCLLIYTDTDFIGIDIGLSSLFWGFQRALTQDPRYAGSRP